MRSFIRITIFLTSLFISVAKAQFAVPNKERAKELKDKKLLVLLLETSDAKSSQYNTLIQKYVSKHWKYNTSIEYKTSSEIKSIVEAAPGQYAVLSAYSTIAKSEMGHETNIAYIYAIGVRSHISSDKRDKYNTVCQINFPSDNLAEYDYPFALEQLQIYLDAALNGFERKSKNLWNMETNLSTLANKTLLLPKELTKIAAADVPKAYPNKFEIIDLSQIINRVEAGDSSILFITPIFSNFKMFPEFAIVDAQSMRVVSLVGIGGVHFGLGAGGITIGSITLPAYEKIHLEYIASKAAQRMNY